MTPTVTQPEPATAGQQTETTEVGSVFVSNYPPFSAWNAEGLPAVREMLAAPPKDLDRPLGLYLHIPFCRKRCKFCYFRVYTDKNSDQISRYTEALAREVELYAATPALAGRRLGFVYFGGGTPSYISVRHLEALVARIKAAWPTEPQSQLEEVTFECEPGTLSRTKLEAIRRAGVTRLSLGVENFNDEILAENGRAHLSKEIYRVMPWIEELGFDQLNIDLIAGMVGETWETWRESVEKTLELEPDSVTIYQLELPFNTRYSARVLDGTMDRPLADWEIKREWQDYAFSRLEEAGYEISSAYTMVKKGQDVRFVYRDSLWHGADLLGTGIASFSHLSGLHFQNSASWDRYLQAIEAGEPAVDRALVTDPEERLIRELILQLKLGRLDTRALEHKFDIDVTREFGPAFERLEGRGMLVVDRDRKRVELSREGLLQVDSLLPEFYEEKYRNARYT